MKNLSQGFFRLIKLNKISNHQSEKVGLLYL